MIVITSYSIHYTKLYEISSLRHYQFGNFDWLLFVVMFPAAIIGGYLGPQIAKRVSPIVVKRVACVGLVLLALVITSYSIHYTKLYDTASKDMVFFTDKAHAIVDINSSGLEMLGYSAAEKPTLRLQDFFPNEEEVEAYGRRLVMYGS